MDTLTKLQRSALMRKIKSKHTKPELKVRMLLRRLGIKYRLYGNLPGSPDIVVPDRKAVIFVHGCFFHNHSCKNGKLPKTRRAFWLAKFRRNQQRDTENLAALDRMGWSALVIWECSLKDEYNVMRQLGQFLGMSL